MKYNKDFFTQLEFLCGVKFNEMQQYSIKDFLKRNDKKHESKTIQATEWSPAVKEIYSKYPAKCPTKGNSTGKNSKCMDKISKLLERYSQSVIEAEINSYVKECTQTKTYMKNFATYLNGFDVIEVKTSLKDDEDVVQYLYNGSIGKSKRKDVPDGAIIL